MLTLIEIVFIFLCGITMSIVIPDENQDSNRFTRFFLLPIVFVALFLLIQCLTVIGSHIYTMIFVCGAIGCFLERKKGETKSKSSNIAQTSKNKNLSTLSVKSSSEYRYISFSYTNSNGISTYRDVDVSQVSDDYIIGYCHFRQELRTFRIDRINDSEVIIRTTGELLDVYVWLSLIEV